VEPSSSVSTVSGYGLDERAIQVRIPAEAKDFSSSLCVQTGSGAHPASCTVCTGGPFPGAKARPGRDADHSLPSSSEVVNEYELHILIPLRVQWCVVGLLYFWTSDQPVAKTSLPTQDNTIQKYKDKHPCLKRDSNPRSQ
jgi:hypothetical protein